ncbi:factor 3 subunit H [Seminavis robusta]|uniref:Eukaryotic translation initiation factor 3 subunit H n=1 Tax=Seminavis robusta TaxID=568900 RepID=A0A9N8EN67_9STRA|nr:factor 3 subunit H [Seminavis robusta]|eukprot:Sro1601_g285210.1 factor 3 subunit H (342) ;mRNA; f:22759-23942
MAAVIDAGERVKEVNIEGLALLKIVKHCHDCLPQMVTGSLLGLVENGVLEVTHAFAFPETRNRDKNMENDSDDVAGGLEGHEYQLEMMRMLREVNVDNNCVGWYQSMYLGIYSTTALLENQFSYQTDLSANAIVVLYDPMQTAHGNLTLKCYRLTDACLEYKKQGKNTYIDPNNIFEPVPVKLTNPGLVRALLADMVVTDGSASGDLLYNVTTGGASLTVNADTTFDRLDLSTNPYLEKHLEYLCTWVDELAAEQQKFQYYTRQLNQRGGNRNNNNNNNKKEEVDDSEGWASSSAPKRMESLLVSNQIRSYCNQMDKFAGGSLGKLFLTSGLHKNEKAAAK